MCALKSDGSMSCWGKSMALPSGAYRAAVSARGFDCGIRVDGTVECWGPAPIPPSGTFITLAASDYDVCGIQTDGFASCWGSNRAGPPANERFTELAARGSYGCGIGVDGSIACWGAINPAQDFPPLGEYFGIAVGPGFGCAIERASLRVRCWGSIAR